MLASTFLDMVLGVDIHFEIVPMSPAPVPFPNPFVGMVWDPGGLLTGQAMGLAMALLRGQPPTGPVLINGMPATNAGTEAKNSMGVPHILIPPGVSWAPMPKLPKPSFKGPPDPPGLPVAPEGDAVCVFGSPTVTVMGSSAVRMADMVMSCGEPVRLPSSQVLAIPKGMPVMIGGPPALSLSDAFGALLKTKWLAGPLHDLLSRMKPGRLRNILSKGVCFVTGHPVDVATGRVLTDHVDWELPGPMPLKFERNYSSAWANRSGPLGHGWSHTLDQAVWAERGRVVYLDAEGREIEFDTFDMPDHVMHVGQTVWEPISRLTLKALGHRRYEIRNHEGVTHHFAPVQVEGATGDRKYWSPLVRIENRGGDAIQLEYDRRGCLEWVTDSAGRQIAFEHDREGRLVTTKLPHPTEGGWLPHTRYTYDRAGDLVGVTDPLGHSWRFAYKQHLLMQETNRNGLSFHFAYDGFGEDAYCVRTWGDGGIYDHVIDYDKMGKVTYVTNSLGHTTTYKINAVGCVVKVTDALGGATAYEYDERSLQKVKETDPVGGETTWEYDARGNCVKTVGPDGATVHLAFNADGQPVRAIDSMKGEWQWGYDERGHLVGRIDSVDRRVQFLWKSDRDESRPRAGAERPKRLAAFVDPAGQQTEIGYDGYGNVAALRTPDGAESRWRYDNLGRCVAAFDAKGNAQKREHDPLGRVVRVWEADGNLRQLDHDPEGNIMRARDKQRDVRFAYQGMGRVVARTEAGTTVEFAYDTEERLRAIKNEHGFAYRFDLGPTGAVDVEWGFDDIRRQYQRDKAGRVTKVFRPDSRETEYTYDPAGRVAAVKHSDGTSETYAYRPDGELVLAKNDDAAVTLERDLLGRVTKELVGDDWVASDYDALGMRIRVRSSKGLDQRIQRNAVGQFIGVRATVGGATSGGAGESAPWEARVRRDILGLEIERTLPGGLQARWERDAIGRPVRQEVHAAGEFRRAVQYTWDINDRLRMVVDATRGPTHYEHDDFGNLAAATYADGSVDLRMPDAVGNLFRTKDRSDRKYGPAGQLLEARGEDGGVTRYEYDAEGNLVWKIEVAAGRENEGQGDEGDGRVWTYWWNVAGLLVKVIRPDGNIVQFVYDALGRRLSKTFREQTTRWIWDGNFPLHEWVQVAQVGVLQVVLVDAKSLDEGTARRRQAERASSSAQGPPLHMSAAALCGPAVAENLARTPSERRLPTPQDGDAETPITWLFEPETFAPMAKVLGRSSCAIITNHLGAPVAMYSAQGEEVWSATIDVYGDLHDLAGDRRACPFRWPGQYEDWETGLYYNRFRYYDSQQGGFISADPIGLQGGLALYQYVQDPLSWKDPLGLSGCGPTAAEELPQMKGMSVSEAERTLASRGFQKTHVSNSPGKNQTWSHPDGSEVRIHPYGNQSTGPWKSGNNAHVHKESPAGAQLTDRGIPSTNPAETHIGISNPPDLPTVRNGRAHGAGTM